MGLQNNDVNDKLLAELLARNYNNVKKSVKLYSSYSILDSFTTMIKNNNYVGLELLLNEHGNISDESGLTPMKIAISMYDSESVKVILESLSYNLDDTSILAFACEIYNETKSYDIVSELLKCNNVDINKKGGSLNETPLFYAIKYDTTKNILKLLLLNDNLNLEILVNNDKSIIEYSLLANRIDALLLIMSTKKIDLTENELRYIFENCDEYVIKHFLEYAKTSEYINEYFMILAKRMTISYKLLELIYPYININYQDVFGKTAIMYVVENNDVMKLEYLLTLNIDLTIIDKHNINVLMNAVSSENYNCAKFLIEYMRDNLDDSTKQMIINQHNEIKESPLLLSAKNNNTKIFKLIYETNIADVNVVDINGNFNLYYFIEKDNDDLFDLLLEDESTDVNMKDLHGNTSLMKCIEKQKTSNIYKLLNHNKIDLSIKNNKNQNVLTFITNDKYGYSSKIKFNDYQVGDYQVGDYCKYPNVYMINGLEYGFKGTPIFNSHQYDNNFKKIMPPTNVMYNSSNNNQMSKLMNYIILKGVDVNSFDIFDKSVFTYAIDNQDYELFNLLLSSNNFNVNDKNKDGQPYLMYLFEKINCRDNNFDTSYLNYFIRLLSHPNLNINEQDYLDNTILTYVAKVSNINLLTKILEHKNVNVNIKNYQGHTPLMIASNLKLWNNVKLLLEYGANPEAVDNNNKKVSDYLIESELFIFNKFLNTLKAKTKDESNKKNWFF
jgi:ankyrin repeat protein